MDRALVLFYMFYLKQISRYEMMAEFYKIDKKFGKIMQSSLYDRSDQIFDSLIDLVMETYLTDGEIGDE